MASTRRPFKICNSSRNKRKGIVIGGLQELREKASVVFGFELSSCRVFLESDGTEIEDEEYLNTVTEQTMLMITDGEEWTASDNVPAIGRQYSSFSSSLEQNESLEIQDDIDAAQPVTEFLLKQIKKNPLYFISFSDEQLLSIIDCDVSYLARGLVMTEHEASFYQDTCQRELDKRTEMQRASDLLKLYDKGMKVQNVEPETKKQKT